MKEIRMNLYQAEQEVLEGNKNLMSMMEDMLVEPVERKKDIIFQSLKCKVEKIEKARIVIRRERAKI